MEKTKKVTKFIKFQCSKNNKETKIQKNSTRIRTNFYLEHHLSQGPEVRGGVCAHLGKIKREDTQFYPIFENHTLTTHSP